jgi:hypothetical protein
LVCLKRGRKTSIVHQRTLDCEIDNQTRPNPGTTTK